MQTTGRTERIHLRVKPEIKKIIEEKQKAQKFKVATWFEEKFKQEFMPPIDKLLEEKNSYLELAKMCDQQMTELAKLDETEKKLVLTDKELRQLVICCDPKFTVKRQWGLFAAATKRGFTFEEFLKIKEKYLDKLYVK